MSAPQGPVVEPAQQAGQVPVLVAKGGQSLPELRAASDVVTGVTELDQEGHGDVVAGRLLAGDVVLDLVPDRFLVGSQGGQLRRPSLHSNLLGELPTLSDSRVRGIQQFCG
ncbi:hypothetical protein AB0D10_19890 [Kitasatospora sp. NPDC048545]|uniref:hypothetical protein n=1 Tax=Kitasatospora sp. NPDC048545 TaxID=3157208 RepID=UPI0034110BC4